MFLVPHCCLLTPTESGFERDVPFVFATHKRRLIANYSAVPTKEGVFSGTCRSYVPLVCSDSAPIRHSPEVTAQHVASEIRIHVPHIAPCRFYYCLEAMLCNLILTCDSCCVSLIQIGIANWIDWRNCFNEGLSSIRLCQPRGRRYTNSCSVNVGIHSPGGVIALSHLPQISTKLASDAITANLILIDFDSGAAAFRPLQCRPTRIKFNCFSE